MDVRTFNTEGPVVQSKHYRVPPLERIGLERILTLVRGEKYFILHAPRQTGKTSALVALQDLLNGGSFGAYRCVYGNLEGGQTAREDVGRAMRAILDEIALRAELVLNDDFVQECWPDILERSGPDGALKRLLTR